MSCEAGAWAVKRAAAQTSRAVMLILIGKRYHSCAGVRYEQVSRYLNVLFVTQSGRMRSRDLQALYIHRSYQVRNQLLGLLFGIILSGAVHAAGGAINPILDDRFTFRLGATYMDAEGTFSSTIKGEPTDKLSTDDLGIDDGNTTPYFGFRWRFADRWRLSFNYFGLDNDGSVRQDFDELIFGDINAKGFLAVDTSFKTDFYVTQVGYSIFKNERAELGVGAGLHIVDFNTRLKVSGEINGIGGSKKSDTADLTVPLPNVLGFGTYAFTPRLSLDGSIGWFGLDYNDYSGNLVSLSANLEYRLTDHFGIGVGYNYIDMNLDIEQSNRTDKYDLEYQGPVLYVSAGF